MVKRKSTPIVIHLDANVRSVAVADIERQIYAQLQEEGSRPKERFFPFDGGRLGPRPRTCTGDFRDTVMAGLAHTPPTDDCECAEIKRNLIADLERRRLFFLRGAEHADQKGRTSITNIVDSLQRQQDHLLSAPLSTDDMREYAKMQIRSRIKKMLAEDRASGLLLISLTDGKSMVQLDQLVSWAMAKKILVEQDALPGCTSLVQTSYLRVHQDALVAPQEAQLPPCPSAPPESDGPSAWLTNALEAADRIAQSRWNSGQREITARNICKAVAVELAKDPTNYGTRGPRTAESVRRDALRGWKFVPEAEEA